MKKLLSVFLLAAMCWVCTAAFAEEVTIDLNTLTTNAPRASVIIGEDSIIIAKAGTYRISGVWADGCIVVDAKKDARITLILDGAEITCADYAPLYLKKAGYVEIVLAEATQNVLTNGGSFVQTDDNNVDAAVFAKCDVIVSGEGGLTIQSPAGNGLTGKDDVTIEGGSLDVTASGHALEANDHLTITAGVLNLIAGKDAIHTENDDDQMLGIFTLEGGTVTIDAEDDAIHAVAQLNIHGGVLNIETCAEGLEAAKVYILDGEIHINAADDAINATIGEDAEAANGEAIIHISGGEVNIVTKGDALDSNGDILMEGGTVIIHGPGKTKFGFGALDYANTAIINGGRLIAFTATGKAFAEESQQPSFNLNLADWMAAGTTVTLLDAQGDVLFSGEAALAFNSVIVSLPELQVGETCTVQLGEQAIEVRQRNMVTKKKAQ